MGLNIVQGPNCVQGPTWSLLKSSKLCWYQPKSLDSLLKYIFFFFFFFKNKFGQSTNKTTFLELSFQIFFLNPKLPPMWPPLLLYFPIAFILSYIYLLLFLRFSKFTMLLSSQFFKLSTLSSSLFSILLSLEVKDDIFGIIDFVQTKKIFGVPMFTKMFQIFCSFVTRMYKIF